MDIGDLNGWRMSSLLRLGELHFFLVDNKVILDISADTLSLRRNGDETVTPIDEYIQCFDTDYGNGLTVEENRHEGVILFSMRYRTLPGEKHCWKPERLRYKTWYQSR